MRIGYGARVAGSVFLLALLLSSGGCGYKTEPVPPASVVPEAIEDLRYTIDETGVKLTWTYPADTVKGTDLVDISSFDVYRAVVSLSDLCETCPIPFGEPLEIPGGVTSEANKQRVAEYRTSLLRSGHKYFFKVRSRTSWWADSADSNIVSFVWHVPTNAPEGLTATSDNSTIKVDWLVVDSLIDGRKVTGDISYQVFRSEGGKDFVELGEPVVRSSFVDDSVVVNQKYFYKVQSLLNFQGHIVNGGSSDIVNAITKDITPPDQITGVTAIQTKSDNKVFWTPSEDPQIAGYRIYRRVENQGKPDLLSEVSKSYTLFVDKNAPKDKRVYYSVTAIDQAEPPNESVKSTEATPK